MFKHATEALQLEVARQFWLGGRHNCARCVMMLAVISLSGILAGCQQKMADQPSFQPLQPSSYFADGKSSRQLVEETIARGHLHLDAHLHTGRVAFSEESVTGAASASDNAANESEPKPDSESKEVAAREFGEPAFVTTFPYPVNADMIEHGRNRYMIYCVVCHDPLGTGRGKIIERGFTQPPSYHIPRLRNAPIGRIFAVITEGYGSMPSYASQIPPRDRWAIAAYVRALQLSQHYPLAELTTEMQAEWNDQKAANQKETP